MTGVRAMVMVRVERAMGPLVGVKVVTSATCMALVVRVRLAAFVSRQVMVTVPAWSMVLLAEQAVMPVARRAWRPAVIVPT